MQKFLGIFTALFLAISGFFAGIPTMINFWDKPGETITDTAKVLALYKDIAAKNKETQFRKTIQAKDLIAGRNDPAASAIAATAKVGMFFINPQFPEVFKGVPGKPASITAADIKSAKAEYYRNGKIVVINIELKEQLDKSNGKSTNQSVTTAIGGSISSDSFTSMKVQVARLGYTLKESSVKYNGSIMVRADTQTGKITAANFNYVALVTGIRNEIALPFQQSFEYTVKKP